MLPETHKTLLYYTSNIKTFLIKKNANSTFNSPLSGQLYAIVRHRASFTVLKKFPHDDPGERSKEQDGKENWFFFLRNVRFKIKSKVENADRKLALQVNFVCKRRTRTRRSQDSPSRDWFNNAATPFANERIYPALRIKSQALNVQSLPMRLQTIRRIQSSLVNY